MPDTILDVSHLTKKFATYTAIDDISFSVKEGEIVGLLGRNGAGKTTTMSMLLGLLTPTSGTIHVLGKDLQKHREEVLQNVNFASAYINFPGRLTVREVLDVFALLYDIPDRNKRVSEMIEMFGLGEQQKKYYMVLSSGQMTRVHLAKALLNKPKILFLDEPTAALDPDTADMVRKLILDLEKTQKLTVVITSHNMVEVEEMCDRAIVIEHGKILVQDSPWGLARRITTTRIDLMIREGMKRTYAYCQEHHFPASIDGRYITIELKDDQIAYFLTFLNEKGVTYQEISIAQPRLEDYFLELSKSRKKLKDSDDTKKSLGVPVTVQPDGPKTEGIV